MAFIQIFNWRSKTLLMRYWHSQSSFPSCSESFSFCKCSRLSVLSKTSGHITNCKDAANSLALNVWRLDTITSLAVAILFALSLHNLHHSEYRRSWFHASKMSSVSNPANPCVRFNSFSTQSCSPKSCTSCSPAAVYCRWWVAAISGWSKQL